MALSLLLALTTAPAMMGTQEAVRDSQRKSRREEYRSQRTNLVVSCVKKSIRAGDIHQKQVVLKDNKLYIDTEPSDPSLQDRQRPEAAAHPFAGYFLPYPDSKYEGLVSTITDEAPILNWIYIDRETHEVKYGVREFAQPNITGPFDWTHADRRLTFEGWEGFAAVEEFPGVWALYFDRDDTGLAGKLPYGTRVLEIEINRREKKIPRPMQEQVPMTLDQKMAELQEQRKREEAEAKAEEARQKQEIDALRRQDEVERQAAQRQLRGQPREISRPRSMRQRGRTNSKGNNSLKPSSAARSRGESQQQPLQRRGTERTAGGQSTRQQPASQQQAKPTALDMLDNLLQSEETFAQTKGGPESNKDSGYDSAVMSDDEGSLSALQEAEQTRKNSFVGAPGPERAAISRPPPAENNKRGVGTGLGAIGGRGRKASVGKTDGNSSFSMGMMARALRPQSDMPSPTSDYGS